MLVGTILAVHLVLQARREHAELTPSRRTDGRMATMGRGSISRLVPLLGLATLGLILLSCRSFPGSPRGPSGGAPGLSVVTATPVPITPTGVASARTLASATPSASLIGIGSLATLLPSTPVAEASATPSTIASSSSSTARPVSLAAPTASGVATVATLPGTHAVPAVALRTVQSSQGDYAIAVPDGWTLNAAPGTGLITITPPGRQEPAIYIIPALRVSDVRYQAILNRCNQQFIQNPLGSPDVITTCIEPAVRAQLADSSHPWSPQAAFPVILALAAGTGTTYGSPTLETLSSTAVRYTVSLTKNGQTLQDWGSLTMAYLPNPLLASSAGQPGVTSLAFLSGCEAPSSQAESFRHACDGVLRSFQPSQQWASNLAQQVMQSYVQESQILLQIGQSVVEGFGVRSAMIQQFGASIRQMQFQAFQTIQAANLRMAQDWIATLANETYVQDPGTGISYLVPAGYDRYCLNDAHNEIFLGGPDLVPGRSVGSPSNICGTLLRPRGD
jgi:hypothetical protein